MESGTSILIAGGSGYIGSAIRQMANQRGIACKVLTTTKSQANEEQGWYFWDPERGIFPEKALEGVSTIINLAGSSVGGSWSAKGKKTIRRSRLLPTDLLVKALQTYAHQVKRFIQASAIGYYPDSPQWMEETSAAGTGFLSDVCIDWESAALKVPKGVDRAVVRIGVVVSPDAPVVEKLKFPARMGITVIPGSKSTAVSWIHSTDLAAAFLHLANASISAGIYNAVAPEVVTNANFYPTINAWHAKQWLTVAVPSFVLRTLLGEKSSLVLDAHRISSERLRNSGFTFQYAQLDDFVRENQS